MVAEESRGRKGDLGETGLAGEEATVEKKMRRETGYKEESPVLDAGGGGGGKSRGDAIWVPMPRAHENYVPPTTRVAPGFLCISVQTLAPHRGFGHVLDSAVLRHALYRAVLYVVYSVQLQFFVWLFCIVLSSNYAMHFKGVYAWLDLKFWTTQW